MKTKIKLILATVAVLTLIIATDAVADKTGSTVVPVKAEMQNSWSEFKAIKMHTDVKVVKGFNNLELGKYSL